jgi:hypothetical protein
MQEGSRPEGFGPVLSKESNALDDSRRFWYPSSEAPHTPRVLAGSLGRSAWRGGFEGKLIG